MTHIVSVRMKTEITLKNQVENTYLQHDTCYYPGIIHLGVNHMEGLHKYIKKHV